MHFDLINDLNIEQWTAENQIPWQGLGTSLVAVIAGNISKSLNKSYQTVLEISKHYKHVIYVDGIIEHNDRPNINETREIFREKFAKYKNITYLYRNTIILDSVAFIGSNGWASFDFSEPFVSKQECFHSLLDNGHSQESLFEQWEMALEDSHYIGSTVATCSKDKSVSQIVIVTNTAPYKDLLSLPKDNQSFIELSKKGSSFLPEVFQFDVNKKIKIWAFGNANSFTDSNLNNVRFVSNPRATPQINNTKFYYPFLVRN